MHFLLTLILQIAVVLFVARAVGWLFRKIHQPQVVGEMAAGIILGPSLLGWVAPGVSAALFPPESLGYLNILSQVGLLFFMFLVGIEFDPKLLRGRGHAVVVTSHVSIIAPFFLGAALALYFYPRLSDDSVSFTGFALFMGAAMSITAFPVLARILTERNLLHTKVGALTIACAAVDDVTAWTILAVVVAIVRASAVETPLWVTLAGTAVYVGLMVLVVRRALGWLESFYHSPGATDAGHGGRRAPPDAGIGLDHGMAGDPRSLRCVRVGCGHAEGARLRPQPFGEARGRHRRIPAPAFLRLHRAADQHWADQRR